MPSEDRNAKQPQRPPGPMARNAIRRLRRYQAQALGCTCRVLLPPGRREQWFAIFPDGYVPVLGPKPTHSDGDPRPYFTLDPRRLTSQQKVLLATTSARVHGGAALTALQDIRAKRFGVLAEGVEVERCRWHREAGP